MENKIIVYQLPTNFTEEELRIKFSTCGIIKQIQCWPNRAILEFEEEDCIESALMFDETEFREDNEGIIKVEAYIEGMSQEFDQQSSPTLENDHFSFNPRQSVHDLINNLKIQSNQTDIQNQEVHQVASLDIQYLKQQMEQNRKYQSVIELKKTEEKYQDSKLDLAQIIKQDKPKIEQIQIRKQQDAYNSKMYNEQDDEKLFNKDLDQKYQKIDIQSQSVQNDNISIQSELINQQDNNMNKTLLNNLQKLENQEQNQTLNFLDESVKISQKNIQDKRQIKIDKKLNNPIYDLLNSKYMVQIIIIFCLASLIQYLRS